MVDTGYITKESALSCFHDWIDRYGHEHSADEMDEYQRIEDLPVEDVRPVVHAEWEQVMGKYDKLFRCSKCHFVPIEPHYFCQNCGADMREVGTDG